MTTNKKGNIQAGNLNIAPKKIKGRYFPKRIIYQNDELVNENLIELSKKLGTLGGKIKRIEKENKANWNEIFKGTKLII